MRLITGRCLPHFTIQERLDFYTMPEPNSGCLLWLGSLDECGYGILRFKGRKKRVHRMTWEMEKGPIPSGKETCHHCDVPCCRNIGHLFLGTHQDNMDDMVRKGRAVGHPRATNPNAKMTEALVMAIRAETRHWRLAAAEYGLSQPQYHRIKRGAAWTAIPRRPAVGLLPAKGVEPS